MLSVEQINRLEQENKELKDELKGSLNSYGELYGQAKTLAYEHATYKAILQEIKEIAEKEVNTRMLFADENSFCDFKQILNLINKNYFRGD